MADKMQKLYVTDEVVHDRSLAVLQGRDYKLARSYIDVLEDLERAIIEADKGGEPGPRPPAPQDEDATEGDDALQAEPEDDNAPFGGPPTPEELRRLQAEQEAMQEAQQEPLEILEPMPLTSKVRSGGPPPRR